MRDEAPALYVDIQKRALAGIGGRSNAIKANCLQCQGWKKQEVRECAVVDCCLWRFRPYRNARVPKKGGVEI